MQWYYAEDRKQQGPVEFEKLVELARNGRLKPSDLVWNESMGNQWVKAETLSGLFTQPPPIGFQVEEETALEWSDSANFKSETPNRDLMAEARGGLDGNWVTAIVGFIAFYLILSVLTAIPGVGGIISFIIGGPMMVGLALFGLSLARREPADLGQLFSGFRQFGNAFLAYLLMALLLLAWSLPAFVMVGVVVGAGLKDILAHDPAALKNLLMNNPEALNEVLAQIPGALKVMLSLSPLIFLATIPAVIAQYRYSLTYYILNDVPGIGPLEAIRRSTQMMVGNKWKLVCLQCRFIGWMFLCLFTFGIGLLWLVPYMMVSMACFYDNVKRSQTNG